MLLDDGGIFIVSTCNRNDASPGSIIPFNKFHVREYLCDEFKAFLSSNFEIVEFYGLKRSKKLLFYRKLKKIGLFDFFPKNFNPVYRFYNRLDYNNFTIETENLKDSLDFIAVCKV